MTTYSKYNFVYRLQKWMDSVPGQTFLNYAYSWGASIVILGTLFKLTHLPGANFFLFLGMGTEVFVFFISAFDRPFDKTADGMELDTHMKTEEEELEAEVGELETILETETFQLYASGDYTYKIENGIVTSMAIQIADDKNDKIVYNQILNTLAKSNSIVDTHNTGGNYYQYADFQIQFDDFEGYEKLTFSVIPAE